MMQLPDGTYLNVEHISRVVHIQTMLPYYKGQAGNMLSGKLNDGFQTLVYIQGTEHPLVVKESPAEFISFIQSEPWAVAVN